MESKIPILVANINSSREPEFQELFDTKKLVPSTVIEKNGLKIGVIGVITKSTSVSIQYNLYELIDYNQEPFLLSRLLLTEGKYMNQIEKILKFQVVLSSGGLDICRRRIKVTACDLAETGHHVHVLFLESGVTGTCRNASKK